MPPRTDAKISGYIAGDDLTVSRDVLNIPGGIRLVKCWLTVKNLDTDADPGLVQKIITDIAGADGQITDTGAGGHGIILFKLSAADTGTTLVAGKTYVFDIQAKFDDNTIATLEKGTISFVQGVTATTV